MKHTREELVKYRFERAKESLEEAIILANSNHWNTVSNRLYYSLFYAVSALLIKHETQGTTHSGVKGQFHKEFIKSGIIDIEYGRLYNNLFNKRQEGDYGDFQTFDKETIEPLILAVKKFLENIKSHLDLY
mgnify:CR=1 FL=1